MGDPTFDTVRRVIAAADPMWRDAAVDQLARDIVHALPAKVAPTDDAVERAARALDPDAWGGEHYTPEYRPMARAVALDKARRALAAARAGEAEPGETVVQQQITVLRDGYAVPQVRTARFGRWRDPDAPAAQRGGEAVDREDAEALAAIIDLISDPERPWYRVDAAVLEGLMRVRDHLAARGDTAPTEVEWGVRVRGAEDVSVTHDQGEAKRIASDVGYVEVVSRDVHRSAWREVTP